MRQRWRRLSYGLMGVAIALIFAACNLDNRSSDPANPDSAASRPPLKPFPEVAELSTPELPDWIEQISPIDEADSLAQIRIRFEAPLIPLESLESPERAALLDRFELVPELPGEFRFLTPRMVGFQGDRALPKATRFQITLKAGLSDLENHELAEDLAWTFHTEPIDLSDLPGLPSGSNLEAESIGLEPTFELTANTALDLDSLRSHVKLVPAGKERSVPIQVALLENEQLENEQVALTAGEKVESPAQRYGITPKRRLEKATDYRLAIAPGIKPAQGNLASESDWDRQLITYAPLAFEGVPAEGEPGYGGAYGRFANGLARLQFNNGLKAESVLEAIAVEPPPKEAPQLLRPYDGYKAIDLTPWALEPNTEYTFTIGAGLTDQFGQMLGEPVTTTYRTGDLSAELWAPAGLNIFPTNQDLQLNISAVNLPEGAYKAAFASVQPTDLVYTDSAYPQGNSTDLLPDPSQWQSISVKSDKNKVTESAIPLAQQLSGKTGMLAYGVQARTVQVEGEWQEPNFYGLVQLTNLGVFAQWFPEGGQVRVHHLADGSPAQADIKIYRSQLESQVRGTPEPCATGRTNDQGALRLDAATLKRCMGARQFEEPPELLAVATENQDWAFVRTWPYSGSYSYGIYADWEGGEPQSRGTIFSDRQLYQPGETAWFTGIADYLDGGVLNQDKQVTYSVTVKDPDGNTVDLGQQMTNDFGTFSLSWKAGEQQSVGDYTIQAKSEAGVTIRGDFRVAEFKPPNFKVDLVLDKKIVGLGEKIEAQTQSNYLFGPPVQAANVAYYVTRSPTDFAPPGWDKYSFGRRWNWPEEKPEVPADVLQTRETLNEAGGDALEITIAEDLPYPMLYRVDAEVSDVSNLSVAAAKTFTVLPSERLIGLKADFVATAGEKFPVEVIVTDAEGKAIASQPVRLELQKATYSRVTQVIEGSRTPVDQVEYKTVATATLRSGKTVRMAELTPPESASYRLRANFIDEESDRTATELRLWATGNTPVFWGNRYNNNRLEVQLDKENYQIGETATALIQSPYPEAELYFAVVRHDTIYETLTRIEGSAPQVQFTVTPEMLPNAAIEAVLVRQGEPLETLADPSSLENLASIGLAPFSTSLEGKYLSVQVKPALASLKPAETETLSLTLKDEKNNPVSGQFTVMVVNEAVLQLSGYRPPDLVETVYAEQPISLRFADNRQDVALSPLTSPLEKGWGYGGGFSSAAASTRLRNDFQALAFYQGSVIADDSGQATVSFELPDDLTTWRAMVIATDGNLRFGQGDATFVATQPLITNPLLPQFLRVGDRLQAGLTVTNTTGKGGKLRLESQLKGGLAFVNTDDSRTRQNQPDSGTTAYRFTMVAEQPGTAQIEFRSVLASEADAFKVPLTIKPLETTEQVVESGTTPNAVTIPLKVADDVAVKTGGLEVSLASNLLSDLKLPAQETLQAEAWPCLETLASRVAIATQLQILSQKYGSAVATDIDLKTVATTALNQMQTLQQPDGGFAAWPGSEQSDPFVTSYAASVLARAQAAGFTVSSSLIEGVKPYLSKLLADPGQYDFCQDADCKNQVRLETLGALASLGNVRNQYLSWLYDQRETFDFTDRVKLARHLTRFADWETEAAMLVDQLQESLYETGRTATVNLPQQWQWLNSQTAAQSQAIRLWIARAGSPEQLDRLVQGLLAQRQAGAWGTGYDNAQALIALADYAQRLPAPPSFEVTVRLGDETLVSQAFIGNETASTEVSVPMAKLPRGESDLQLQKSGEGELHYLAAYRYRLKGNPPGRLNGLRISRRVYPANQSEALHQFGLAAAEETALPVGQVFDVGLEIIADHPVNHVIITDPLPAGLEAVDTTFQTVAGAVQAQADSWQIGYQQIYSDRILAYSDHLDAGVYSLHYLVRSVTPGTFLWPGATAQLQYAPEEFGRTTAATLLVR